MVGRLTFPTFSQHWAPPPVLQSLEDVAVGVAVTVTVCVGSSQSAFGAVAAAEAVRARAATARMRVSENILAAIGEREGRSLLACSEASGAVSLLALLRDGGLCDGIYTSYLPRLPLFLLMTFQILLPRERYAPRFRIDTFRNERRPRS